MAANNMLPAAADLDREERQFAQEVEEVKRWWSDSRWRFTRRPFTAEQVVSKRGNLKIEYPSNAQAKKLWKTLENRFQVCEILPLEMTRRDATERDWMRGVRQLVTHTTYTDFR
jgi:hypothetical protein